MFVKIKKVELNGLLVDILKENKVIGEGWLPSDQWSSNVEDWNNERDSLEISQQLYALELTNARRGEHKLVVSRKEFKLDNIDDSWMSTVHTMKVDSVSKNLIRGHIGTLSAVMELQKYLDFFEKRIDAMSVPLLDHRSLASGDMLSGFVVSIPPDELKLDPGQYLDDLNKELHEKKTEQKDEQEDMVVIYEHEKNYPLFKKENIKKISPVLLLENHESFLRTIEFILKRAGAEVQSAKNYEEAKKLVKNIEHDKIFLVGFKLAIIDPNLDPENTDLSGMQIFQDLDKFPECRLIIITGEENERKASISNQIKVHGFIDKPFTTEELFQTIEQALEIDPKSLAEWIQIGVEEDEIQHKKYPANKDDSEVNNAMKVIQEALEELVSVKPGTVVHVFEMHPRSFRARSLASVGSGLKWVPFRGKIGLSRIKDTALGNSIIIENITNWNPALHLWTSQMMNYKSFCGIPIHVIDSENKHTLVAFHQEENAFDDKFRSNAILCVERVARALERKKSLEVHQNEAAFIAAGMGFESLAHELANELSDSEFKTNVLLESLDKSDALTADNINKINNNILEIRYHMKEAIAKTSALRGISAPKESVSIGSCLYRAAIGCRSVLGKMVEYPKDIKVELPPKNPENDCEIKAAPAALIIVFLNLYLNAVQQINLMRGIRKCGHVWHSIERHQDEQKKPWFFVRIHDTGPGIHFDDWERVYDPGYTTKPDGMGFGLFICRYLINSIVESQRHAKLEITRSVLWDGTTFTVKFPVSS